MCLPMQETWVQSLGQEDPLEKDMAYSRYGLIHSKILAWEIHGQRSLPGYSPWGCKRVRHDRVTKSPQNIQHQESILT